MNDYTEQQIVDYAINTLGIQKTRKRHYLDNRNYLIHVLYHKFKWTERRLQDLFLVERSGINHNKYLVMDLMEGGDLRFHHAQIRKFPHSCTQFFIACLI
jgi:serine/threonine protein kinase